MPLIRRKDEPLFGQPLMLRDEMNKLFERFIFVQLRRAVPCYAARGLKILDRA